MIHPPHRCGISRCWLDSMITAQVSLRLATIKGYSKMCSFITQHKATDVASFEGACNWHADCRNVHKSCCLWIECSFLYHKPSPKAFQRIWQYIQPASQPQTRTSTSSIFTSKIIWDQPPGQLLQQSVCITKEFLHKLSETLVLYIVWRRGHLLWLTGNCVQLNWSSSLLDGYKKLSLPRQPSRQPSCEALLVRRPKSVKTIDSTARLHRAGHRQGI